MKRLSTIIAVGLALAAMAAGVSPTLAQPVTSLDSRSLVPAFGQPQSAQDRAAADHFPAHIAARLDLSSLRVLGRDSGGIYSTALDKTGQQVCVIAQMISKVGSINTACLPKTDFAQTAISMGIGENLGGATPSMSTTTVYFFPAGVDLVSLNAATLDNGTGRNAIVQHGGDALPQHVELNRSDSKVKFAFTKLGHK